MGTELSTARWVEVYRGQDHLMIQMLAGALESQGFTVRIHGSLSGAAIGAGEGVASVALLAPSDQADEVGATLEEMFAEAGGEAGLLSLFEGEGGELAFESEAGAGALTDAEGEELPEELRPETFDLAEGDGGAGDAPGGTAGEDDDDDGGGALVPDRMVGLRPRQGWIAGGLSLLSAGLGHLYAGESWYGVTALVGSTLAVYSAAGGGGHVASWAAIAGFTFIDSMFAANRANQGTTRSPVVQLLLAAAVVGGGQLLAGIL